MINFGDITIPPDLASLLTRLDFTLEQGWCFPGEPVGFAWRVLLPSTVHWRSADLEIVLVSGANEEHLWDQVGIAWPPRRISVEDTDGIWPPVGWVADALRPLGAGRTLLYAGVDPKTIRLKITGHKSDGSQQMLSADGTLTVALPLVALTAAITAPRAGSWGTPYSLSGSVANSGLAQLSGQVSISGDDHSSFPPVTVRLAPATAQMLTLAGPITQTWPWNDHPTYHVHEDQLVKRFAYRATVTSIQDEFGNAYPDVAAAPFSVTIRVPDAKIDAAHQVEQDFWATTGTTACSIVSGVLAAIPILTIAAALIGGGCATGMVLSSIDSSQWSQVADDPPAPDDDFWTVLPLPDPITLPEKDDLAPLNQLLVQFCRISSLLLVGSATVGKILGARLAASEAGEAVQQQQFQQIVNEIQRAMAQIPVLTAPAVQAVANHAVFTDPKLQSLLSTWSTQGVSADEAKLLSQALGQDAAANLIKFLSQPQSPQGMPSMPDIVAGMAHLALRAAGSGLQDLMAALALSVKRPASSGISSSSQG